MHAKPWMNVHDYWQFHKAIMPLSLIHLDGQSPAIELVIAGITDAALIIVIDYRSTTTHVEFLETISCSEPDLVTCNNCQYRCTSYILYTSTLRL